MENRSKKTEIMEVLDIVPKPVGVAILSWLHLLGGIAMLAIMLMPFFIEKDVAAGMREAGISPVLLFLGVLLLALLGIGSGLGMMLRKSWGWFLAVYWYTYSIFRNGNALYTVGQMADQFDVGSRNPEYYYMKHSVRIVISLLLIFYLFKGNVLSYFYVSGINKARVIGYMLLLNIALFVIFMLGSSIL